MPISFNSLVHQCLACEEKKEKGRAMRRTVALKRIYIYIYTYLDVYGCIKEAFHFSALDFIHFKFS